MQNNDKVMIFLRGGLGNQLFQYAFGLYASKKQHRPLEIRGDLLPSEPDVFMAASRWPEHISAFNHSGHLVTKRFQPAFSTNFVSKQHTLLRMVMDRSPEFAARAGMLGGELEHNWMRLLELVPRNRPVILDGYFQSRLFPETLRDQLTIELTGSVMGSLCRDEFALHLRFGDNIGLIQGLFEKYIVFYQQGLDKVQQHLGFMPRLAVFSDDEELALSLMNNLRLDLDFEIKLTQDLPPIEVLRELASHSGLLAFASTFAWWGGFLQRNQSNIFLKAPDGPSGAQVKERLMFPSWHLVPSSL